MTRESVVSWWRSNSALAVFLAAQLVGAMHAILLQAKGARWVIVGLAGVAGLASGVVSKFIP